MNDTEYVAGALRTEAPVTPELTARMIQPGVVDALLTLLAEIVESGQDVDALKKYIYYGKETERLVVDSTIQSVAPSLCKRLSDPLTIRLIHAIIGLHTEVAEMATALSRHIQDGTALDMINMLEEAGDLYWYLAIFSDATQIPLAIIKERNNAKLRARYPEKFTALAALTRDLTQERRTLEAKSSTCLQISSTIGGHTARITEFNNEHGYIHGTIDGIDGPQLWGHPDGHILSLEDEKYNLDMETV